MGTRSLTIVTDENGCTIANMYRQFDGYPEGHGVELAEFLNGMLIVDGISGREPDKFANGLGCLSAQIVAHFKHKPGDIYLYPIGEGVDHVDYIYKVTGKVGGYPIIQCKKRYGNEMIFDGNPQEFIDFVNEPQNS